MDTKDRILNSYLLLGQRNGFLSVSLSQVSEMAGIKKATLFSHFKDKEELINQAIDKCLKTLDKAEFNIDFKAKDREDLFVGLINSFTDIFTEAPVSALLSFAEQLRSVDERALKLSEDIDRIITSRLLVALDYCVQRSWSSIDYTDALAEILCPNVRNMINGFTDQETFIDNLLQLI